MDNKYLRDRLAKIAQLLGASEHGVKEALRLFDTLEDIHPEPYSRANFTICMFTGHRVSLDDFVGIENDELDAYIK